MDHLLVQIAILVILGRILGEVARRLGQPPVLGELLGGICLGPTILGKLWPNAQAVAQLMGRLSHRVPFDTTVMHVERTGESPVEPSFAELAERLKADLAHAPTLKEARSSHPVQLIQQESTRGYQLMVLGAGQSSTASLFTHAIDSLLRDSGCAVAVVHVPPGRPGLDRIEKIMAPTTGTAACAAALELSAALACAYEARLTVVHVLEWSDPMGDPAAVQRLVRVAHSLLEQQTEIALRHDPSATAQLLQGASSEAEILRLAEEDGYDLIVLRGSLRHNLGRAFLGHRADRLLKSSPCPVVVLCNP